METITNEKILEELKDEAYLIDKFCDSIKIACVKILDSASIEKAEDYQSYLSEKVERLNKRYGFLEESFKKIWLKVSE